MMSVLATKPSLKLPVAEGLATPLRAAPVQHVYTATRPFHVMTKPIGPICNLDCKYCFYLEKEALYNGERKWQMSDDVLEQYIRQYIKSQPGDQISFAWQGGEPTLLGVRFFRRVIELQQRHAEGRRIDNAFQTNGTLLDDEWGEFLKKHNFLVGLSVDGPPELHDAYRVGKQGNPSSDGVLRGLAILKKHGVDFNTLTVVNRKNSQHPLKVYNYLKEIGSGFLQFIPLVERDATDDAPFKDEGLWLQGPPDVDGGERYKAPVTDWSVRSRDYGTFLATIFDEWIRKDVGETFVQMFDVALGNWLTKLTGQRQASLCVFSETCGTALAVEHNGDVYSCDHYVYPRYKLGNVMQTPLTELVESPFQKKFGLDKRDQLPRQCRECEVRHACHGECPKHRFMHTADGEDGLNYLCGGYRPFFNHIDPAMRTMAELLATRRPPAMVREIVAEHDRRGGPLGRRWPKPKAAKKKRR
jgi:uncharacterized protein